MVAITTDIDPAKETRTAARGDIDRRVEALLNSLDADTPDNPTAKNFGQSEIANLREYVKRATQEGLPTLTSSQMTELLAQAAEGKNIKPLDPKAEIRPDDIRSADAEPQGTSMANAIVALGAPGSMRTQAVAASASVDADPFALAKPITPARDEPERAEGLAR